MASKHLIFAALLVATIATPMAEDATVQLRCGGNVVSTAVTNGSGVFSILLDPLSYLLSAILSNCNAVVTTPLSNCNSLLSPTGVLSAPLQILGSTVSGLLPVTNIITGLFQFLPIV
ncbi:hypothetical protein RJ641_004273 [Dillenia turbinata]|uniref:Phylloplanin-like n=1 Tax=Dillenia turbinata TaxID=194707 RepID=A0AAN8Z832_9MAGN